MDWKTRCAAVIPCLNEAERVGPVISGVRKYVDRVIVIDDGSADTTAQVARDAGAQLIVHSRPRGKGAALLAGWAEAKEAGFLWALSLDGDGQHAPEDIPAFFACAEATGATLISGNRMNQTAVMPLIRRWVNRWMTRQLSRACRQPLADSQCGFRLINLAVLSQVPLNTSHFELESEILLRFGELGQRIEFVPIQVIYGQERSKIHPWRDTVRWFRWWKAMRTRKTATASERRS